LSYYHLEIKTRALKGKYLKLTELVHRYKEAY